MILSDFGVARMLELSNVLTGTGAVIGTPAYMSPAQADGKRAGPASDLYSLGIVLYELLTGRVPLQAETPMAVVHAHIDKPLPPPRSVNPVLTEVVEAVVFKALAKEPGDRFSTGSMLVSALLTRHYRGPSRPDAGQHHRPSNLQITSSRS